ncbi:putative 2OG-Fe(II) oxygenase [Pelagerythrobacter marensis]|uniref:2OG-Fe(II) oxygenase n=1 Tax=Pelagerythrobacter marensis TaxID=543877 RepID=A0ABZ2DE16_9SPHN
MPTGDEHLIRAAIAARNAGDAREWIARLERRLDEAPDNSRLWHTLGTLHRAELETEQAIAAFSRALQLDAASAVTAHALARATLEAGRPAVDLYDAALALAPADGTILVGRAAALSAEGQAGRAIEELRTLLHSNPRWADGHKHLAEMLVAEGRADEQLATLDAAIGQYPRDPQLRATRLDILYRGQQFAELAAFAEACERALGASDGLTIYKAIALSELGQSAKADSLFASILPTSSPELASHAMRHHLRCGRPETAATIGEALLDAPGSNHVWSWLGTAWRLLGDSRAEWFYRPDLVQTFALLDGEQLERLVELLRGLHRTRSAHLGQSVRQGTQTDGPLLARTEPEIVALRKAIVSQVAFYMAALVDDRTHPVLAAKPSRPRIAGSWSVRLQGGGYHANHVHPEGWISAALYFVTPDSAADDPHAGWLSLGEPPKELDLALEPLRLIEPVPGRLVLFPSTTWHGTRPIDGGERLTVAFDIAPAPPPANHGE